MPEGKNQPTTTSPNFANSHPFALCKPTVNGLFTGGMMGRVVSNDCDVTQVDIVDEVALVSTAGVLSVC